MHSFPALPPFLLHPLTVYLLWMKFSAKSAQQFVSFPSKFRHAFARALASTLSNILYNNTVESWLKLRRCCGNFNAQLPSPSTLPSPSLNSLPTAKSAQQFVSFHPSSDMLLRVLLHQHCPTFYTITRGGVMAQTFYATKMCTSFCPTPWSPSPPN